MPSSRDRIKLAYVTVIYAIHPNSRPVGRLSCEVHGRTHVSQPVGMHPTRMDTCPSDGQSDLCALDRGWCLLHLTRSVLRAIKRASQR